MTQLVAELISSKRSHIAIIVARHLPSSIGALFASYEDGGVESDLVKTSLSHVRNGNGGDAPERTQADIRAWAGAVVLGKSRLLQVSLPVGWAARRKQQ